MCSYSEVFRFFSDNTTLIDRGENHLRSSHLQSFDFDASDGQIRGQVQASMRDTIYSTEVCLKNKKIDAAYCTCPKGNYKCSHMATLLLYFLNNCSSTDQPCQWNRPKSPLHSKSLENIFGKNEFRALQRKPDNNDKEFLLSALKPHSYTGIYWILSEEPVSKECTVLSFDELLNLCEFENMQQRVDFMLENLNVSENDIINISTATVGQKQNYLWGQFRKGRITSSNFALVINAVNSGRIPPSLLKNLKGEYFVENVKSVQWGICHEKEALKLFEEVKVVKVQKVGLFLHNSGKLGCSPDGIIGEEIIEIKCPFSKINSDLLKIISDGKWYLKFTQTEINAELRETGTMKVYIFPGDSITI